jgi:branched-chain amino acid transport system permease protein
LIFFLQNLVTGIMVGLVYATLALGFVVLYKSTSILNFAQGAIVSLGAYICWSLMEQAGLYTWLSVVLTLFICFGLGVVLEYFPIRPLAKRVGGHSFVMILATFMLLIFFTSLVVLIWGGIWQRYPTFFPSKPITVSSLIISQEHFWSALICAALLVIFMLIFRYTKLGLLMRGAANNLQITRSLGVRVNYIIAIAWGICSVICGIGGILLGAITVVNLSLSEMGLAALPAAIVGGMNSIPGAIAGGLIMGVTLNIFDAYIGSGFGIIGSYIIMISVLLIRPWGILGQEKVERV